MVSGYLGCFTGDYHRRLPFRTFHANGRGRFAAFTPSLSPCLSIEINVFSLYHVLVNAAKTTSVVMFLVVPARVSARLITIAGTRGVRFAAAAGRLSATLIYRHYDLSPIMVVGMVMVDANGVNSYPVLCH
ncbi:hypothetical protein KCP78_18335 [Salmonella enterica subsp. enterica]|nr:hypothetical protein KCP78_18335 [Salmonella enterica subsp. enterica]